MGRVVRVEVGQQVIAVADGERDVAVPSFRSEGDEDRDTARDRPTNVFLVKCTIVQIAHLVQGKPFRQMRVSDARELSELGAAQRRTDRNSNDC